MAKSTLYNLNIASPAQINDEPYSSVGSDSFILGTIQRAFHTVEIYDGTDTNATQLTVGVDYELLESDTTYTALAGTTVYTKVKILNATYQTGNIYISYKCIGSYTDVNSFAQKALNILSITADYTVLDNDGYDLILVDPSGGDVDITLPTASANEGRLFRIKVSALGGLVTVDGEGAETIDGDASVYLNNIYDHVDIWCDGTEWFIDDIVASCDTGWISRNDWTAVHPGSINLDYDNLSGAFKVGELVTGQTSGDTGIIQSDDGSTLILKNVTSGGIFQNNEQIAGATSGATADVNETSGSAKNKDTNNYHQLGKNIYDLQFELYVSTDGTDNNSFKNIFATAEGGSANYGGTFYQVDTNNIKIQTGPDGIYRYADDDGATLNLLDTDDFFYKTIVRRVK
ncbi:MAG: hypothetical protein JSW06_02800 [Thermoplasmatales archaeon]|nr:MAG: hypothetical protein JSW06_02800 [Thermoplasmatales archaeon]